ncbi:MAG: hypothetical protein MUF87_08865 [Anaerolineae bacterium]|jgi:hypothetical protein|nr:hypothetical protein [Anaerolineae bacterium]
MSDAAVKETRRVLRQVQSHLTQSRLNLGAISESLGFVDVIYHPKNILGDFNYITPRKSTAWISIKEVENGLNALRARERVGRIEYIEGLYPPLFARNLMDLGLSVERENPIMVYQVERPLPTLPPLPDGISIDPVSDQDGCALWWYVWRNAYYDVITQTAEPLYVGQNMRAIALGYHLDLVMHRYRFPVGVARISLYPENHSAHLLSMVLMKEVRTPDLIKLFQRNALQHALDRGVNMVFTSGDSEIERKLCRENGFMDYGSMIWYSEGKDEQREHHHEQQLAQSLLLLRSTG